jgi:hypothetical protein
VVITTWSAYWIVIALVVVGCAFAVVWLWHPRRPLRDTTVLLAAGCTLALVMLVAVLALDVLPVDRDAKLILGMLIFVPTSLLTVWLFNKLGRKTTARRK